MFFFFKQKTAYEMRISDWSSDVCSSDLRIVDSPSAANGHSAVNKPTAFAMHANARRARSRSANARPRAWLAATCSATAPTTVATTNTADRKSVGEGTSVSVRVDLGGSRIIKKKTTKKHTKPHKKK